MTDATFKKYCLVVDEWLINGFNGRQAYKSFYPDASDVTAEVNFSKILSIAKVAKYKAERQKELSDNLNITLESQIVELGRLKKLAEEDKKYSDSINALKEQNKLLALYSEHNKQKQPKPSSIVFKKAKKSNTTK